MHIGDGRDCKRGGWLRPGAAACAAILAAVAAALAAGAGCAPRGEATVGLEAYRLVAGPKRVEGVGDNLSGLSYDARTGTLWAVLNGPETLLEMTPDGRVVRTVALAGGDTEGVEVLGDGRLAVVEELTGRLVVFRLVESGGETGVDAASVQSLQVEDEPGGNTGLEGLAYDAAGRQFFIVKEKNPPRLYEVRLAGAGDDLAGAEVRTLWEFGEATVAIDDAAGCHYDPRTGHLLVVSDESACVVECTLEGREVGRLAVAGVPKAEGVTLDADGALYVVSEPNLFMVYRKKGN